jgi:demethoxyubiquinone hydroxylase (CLK1/Coq7/Cat5 family)
MWNQEKKHLLVMNKLQAQHRIRPTILIDVAKTAGFSLGVVTALLGTEAVETVIGEHYDEYIYFLSSRIGSEKLFQPAERNGIITVFTPKSPTTERRCFGV